MSKVNFFKVTVLPESLEKDAFYYVIDGDNANTFLTDKNGVAKKVGNTAMINDLIAKSGLGNDILHVADDISKMEDLTETSTTNLLILVIDASADPTVDSGSALYVYSHSSKTTTKVAEYESMDVVLDWDSIKNKPSASTSDIDDAVSKKHSHSNLTVLNDLSDEGGKLAYKGESLIGSTWAALDW